MRTIKDEFGTTWYVEDKEDPAGPLCKALDKAGFEEIALPREAILTGRTDFLADYAPVETALAGLSLLDKVGKRVRQDLIDKAEHQARVFLCWRALTS